MDKKILLCFCVFLASCTSTQISTSFSPTFTLPPPTLTFTPALPTETNTPVFISTTIATATPLPEEINDSKGITMRLVPAGTFPMGSKNGHSNEQPVHEVYLDAYYMDIYEVTNSAYKLCADTGICEKPTKSERYTLSTYAQYPVVFVNWDMAKTYCEWRGGRLPTEAEWEKAARGTDGRTYPWGEVFDCANLNCSTYSFVKERNNPGWNDGINFEPPVGNYESGKSPYGMYDMAGNVMEWVND